MNTTSVSELRKNMASHLEEVKFSKKPLVFGNRNKKEFLILPYPDTHSNENLFEVYEDLEDKIIQTEYYKGLKSLLKDWNSDEHEDLFLS